MNKPLSLQQQFRKADALVKSGEIGKAREIYLGIQKKFPKNQKVKTCLASINLVKERHNPEGFAAKTQPVSEQRNIKSLGDISKFADPLDRKTLRSKLPPATVNQNDVISASTGKYTNYSFAEENEARLNYDRGNEQVINGNYGRAVEFLSKAIDARPNFGDAHYSRSEALIGLKRYDDALASLSLTLQISPDLAKAHYKSGYILALLRRFGEAESCLKKAIDIEPDFVAAQALLANAMHALDRSEEALLALEKALKIGPEEGDLLTTKGTILSHLGKKDEAILAFSDALAFDPKQYAALYLLGHLKRFEKDDPEIGIGVNALQRTDITKYDRSLVHFFLAKTSEDNENYAEAFSHLADGNRLRKEIVPTNIDYALSFEAVRKVFQGPEGVLPVNTVTVKKSSVRPIYIFGMPRSGTSITEQILASHSKVYGGGEMQTTGNVLISIGGIEAKPTDENLQIIRDQCLSAMEKLDAASSFVTDKTPQNFINLGYLIAAMPDAKFINMTRDPMAVCWSCFKQNFGSEHPYSYTIEGVAKYYNLYLEMMEFWRKKYPNVIYDLNYDRLTLDQENETRKLLEYVGLDWEDQCLDFQNTKRSVRTASDAQVREKMYTGSSFAWKKYEEFLGPMSDILYRH